MHDISSFSKSGLKPTFMGKVMTLFALAIATTTAGVFVSFAYLFEFFLATPALMWVVYIVEIAIIFTSGMWSQKRPLNYLLFATFALLSGITIAPLIGIVAQMPNGVAMIGKALASTAAMFIATGIFGWTTKMDLSGLRGFLMTALIGIIIVSIIGIFLPWSNNFEMFFSGFGVILFSGFIMYDFQRIKHYPENRTIEAALALYLDIFNLFIYILRLMLSLSSRD
ncbi:hypothetical protein COU74_02190 [Candidatus Peregrinibacteria bacterium CG10_big_fil_rev_8_21_14_0_10_36_19]|nr:MAG: hypothetical protein COU74_02190 [Candidatus Peregrinibacteria bacterium CG10_big_fil_rev_8_21_14_0_10_36_19]